MSYIRPSTPTKNRSIPRPLTPSKLKSMSSFKGSGSTSSVNLSSSTKVLDEINLLLYLETLKRNKENETFLKQKVEEAYKLFEEKRHKYCSLVAKYTALIKLACTRNALLHNELIDLPTESVAKDAQSIKEKLLSGSVTDFINTAKLNIFKNTLQQMDEYKNIPSRRLELVELQKITDEIQYSIEAIEISLEKCITQGLDHFIDSLDMENYPKLLEEHQPDKY